MITPNDSTFAVIIAALTALVCLVTGYAAATLTSKPKLCEIDVVSTSTESHVWVRPCHEARD